MNTLEVAPIPIGDSVGIVLPGAILARLKLQAGDTVFLTESTEGLFLSPFNPALKEEITTGRDFMRENNEPFHPLAQHPDTLG